MPSIKDLKKRISSTKNTQQTTKALKMVSAAKLRRAQDAITSQRPYAQEIANLMSILSGQAAEADASVGRAPVSLMIVMSSDRGLCGGYNSSAIRAATNFLAEKKTAGKAVKTVFVGKKVSEIVRLRATVDVHHYEEFGQKVVLKKATELAKRILPMFEKGEVDEVFLIYNEFKNAMTQEIRTDRVLPIAPVQAKVKTEAAKLVNDLTIYEPGRAEIYEALKAKYFVIQIFKALLESQASEHGARMSAMENATKNAGDMIRKLTLQYNKQRQAGITKELLEIIAGSESQKQV